MKQINNFWNWYDKLKEPYRFFFAVFILCLPLHLISFNKYIGLLMIPLCISWLTYIYKSSKPKCKFKIGDEVQITKDLHNLLGVFKKGHIFTITHIMIDTNNDYNDFVNLKDNNYELLFVDSKYLKLIK